MADERTPIDLNAMVPTTFGEWRMQMLNSAHIVDPQTQVNISNMYSDTLTRTYVNNHGHQIMLSIAYGKNQSDALQLHKPGVCYPAQGFELKNKQVGTIELGQTTVPATQLMTTLQQRREPVTYLTVVGDYVTTTGLDKKMVEIRYALENCIPDGLLVRVSAIDGQVERAYEIQRQFASEMVAAITSNNRSRFTGKPVTTVAAVQ